MEITTVGDFTLGWGEGLRWDERRQRLWFVDCAAQTIHWLDGGDPGGDDVDLHTMQLPSMASCAILADDERLVAVLDDGLAVVDPDAGSVEPLAPYPEALGGRANDACADFAGNVITGKMNLEPAEGSTWRFSVRDGWTLLDPDITNTNGPALIHVDGVETLVIGDTSAVYWAAPYDSATGKTGERRVFGDTEPLEGRPDGSTVDAENGLWCALVGGGQVVRFTSEGLDRQVPVPAVHVTDVAFGGPDLDRLYVASVAGEGELAGRLLRIDGLGVRGRAEPRVALG